MGIPIKKLELTEEQCIALIKAAFGNKCTSELGSMN